MTDEEKLNKKDMFYGQECKKHFNVLSKINNITGFLPLNMEQILEAIKNEMNEVFAPYVCNWNLLDIQDDFFCNLSKKEKCKALKDQLPIIIECGHTSLCCSKEKCKKGFSQHICVPLIAGTEVFGVITLKSNSKYKLNHDLMELLLAIVNQVAATIQRYQLFARLYREEKNLKQANREITQLNSELQETIKELKEAQQQFIYLERLAAAGRLAANLAHEINNPVGIIMSRLEWLLLEAKENNLPDNLIRDLQVIKKHTKRIANTTRGLLSFSRQVKTEFAPLNLTRLIKEVVEWLERSYSKKGIKIVLKLKPLPFVEGNTDQLEQVFINLLTNAKDAISEGGKITIETNYFSKRNIIQIKIKDTGTGIPQEISNNVFDPFFTTKKKYLGTGLGLPVSLAIIREHGGFMKLKSIPRQGSCFSIFLPCQQEIKEGDHNVQ